MGTSLCKAVVFTSNAGCWSLQSRQWAREDGCRARKSKDKLLPMRMSVLVASDLEGVDFLQKTGISS